LGDMDKSGKPDLVMGNYFGNLIIIPNTGTMKVPEWKQPKKHDAAYVPTRSDGQLWINLLAPDVYDWDGDGKMDVIVGEGGYSANAIHLLRNSKEAFEVKGKSPFNEDNRHFLGFGDGLEHLVPAVADWKGNGQPDILVGDRTGHVWWFRHPGRPWKATDRTWEMKNEGPIDFGGQVKVGTGADPELMPISPAVADLNGDGLLDIIIGRTNGRIVVSYNIGTKDEPKFGPLEDIKGEKVFKRGTIRSAENWGINFGYHMGNLYGVYTVVSPDEDPEAAGCTGKNVLKFHFLEALNKTIKKPAPFIINKFVPAPGFPEPKGQFAAMQPPRLPSRWDTRACVCPRHLYR